MSNLKLNTEIITTAISDLKPGDIILNLGEVLEIEENPEIYSIIIFRMNQKQVFKFEKNINLYLAKENEPA